MSADTSLLSLPPELLIRISTSLNTTELGHLRCSCKDVEKALFETFAREFFTKRQFMIEHPSLQALVDIANHPTIARFLVEVIISVHTLPSPYAEYERAPAKALYDAGYVNREVLLHTGLARDMLAEAFSKLTNLRTVGLRDYEGKGRIRDGENARWRSYGWTFGRDQDDATPVYLGASSPASTFPLMLSALGEAQARPANFDIFLRKSLKLTPSSFNVVDGLLGRKVKPVLAGLKRLMLTINSGDPFRYGRSAVLKDENSMNQVPIQRFLQSTVNLETLRLNFEPDEDIAEPVLKWLGELATIPFATGASAGGMPSVSLPSLRCLDLGMLLVAGPTLIKLITKFNLTHVNLWKITLKCEDKVQRTTDPSRWSLVLDSLSKALPSSTRIKHLAIGYPTQGLYSSTNGTSTRARVVFGADSDPEERATTAVNDQVTYRAAYGSSIKHWLGHLAARSWAPDVHLPDSSDEDSDAEADEDEDGDGDEDEDGEDEGDVEDD